MARLPYLEADDVPEEHRWAFHELERTRGFVPNLHRALAHSPALMAEFLRMTTATRAEALLPTDLKELAILAVADATGTVTIAAVHASLAAAAGLSTEQVSAVGAPGEHSPYSEHQRAVIAFAVEVTRDVRVRDETWSAVAQFLDAQQLTELTLTVAFYNMVARLLEPLQVDVDPRYATDRSAQ